MIPMDDLVSTIITQLPNLGVAVWMLWQQQQTIKSLLSTQQALIDRLLTYVDNDKSEARNMVLGASQPPKAGVKKP
jgi:hypothetical protein